MHVLVALPAQRTAPHAQLSAAIPCPVISPMEAALFGLERLGQQYFKWRSCATSNAVSRPVPASCMNEQRSSQLRIACSLGPLQA